jgi:hypothetical protein
MHAAKALRRLDPCDAPHRPYALCDASMVLFQGVIQRAVRAMAYLFP